MSNAHAEDASDIVQSFEIAREIAKRTTTEQQKAVDLSQQFSAACLFLQEATNKIPETWVKFLEDSKVSLEEARQWRMAMEREVNQGMRALKDMTEFLGSPETDKRLKTMRELVELAERLEKLKTSGFLDAMVDTLVKMPAPINPS